jgi:DNA-binding NarL/FixJ family response regulator
VSEITSYVAPAPIAENGTDEPQTAEQALRMALGYQLKDAKRGVSECDAAIKKALDKIKKLNEDHDQAVKDQRAIETEQRRQRQFLVQSRDRIDGLLNPKAKQKRAPKPKADPDV